MPNEAGDDGERTSEPATKRNPKRRAHDKAIIAAMGQLLIVDSPANRTNNRAKKRKDADNMANETGFGHFAGSLRQLANAEDKEEECYRRVRDNATGCYLAHIGIVLAIVGAEGT